MNSDEKKEIIKRAGLHYYNYEQEDILLEILKRLLDIEERLNAIATLHE